MTVSQLFSIIEPSQKVQVRSFSRGTWLCRDLGAKNTAGLQKYGDLEIISIWSEMDGGNSWRMARSLCLCPVIIISVDERKLNKEKQI